MTRKEFENLTKRIIAPEDYRLIENLYMAAGEMDKVEFCKEIRIMCAYDGANDRIEIRRCLKELGKRVGTMDAELNFLKRETKRKHAELAEILIGKQRNGPIGTATLAYLGSYTAFEDLEPGLSPQPSEAGGE